MSLEVTQPEVAPEAAPVSEAAPVEAPATEESGGTLVTETETPEQKAEREAEEAKAAETPEQKAAREAEEAKAHAPQEYAEFKMPEGIKLDETAETDFKALAKELDLNQDKAQRLVDLAADMRKRDAEAILNVRQEWLDQSKADKGFGGDKLNENLAIAKRGLEAYGSPELKSFLDQSGLGNHPEIIRLLVNAGKSVAEDKVIPAGRPAPPNSTLAQRLYGNPTAKE